MLNNAPSTASTTLLVIAGYEPNGYAGILADTNLAGTLNVHTVSVTTAETNQQTASRSLNAIDYTLVASQIDAALQHNKVDAIKIGQIPDSSSLNSIATTLSRSNMPIIWDPVLMSSSSIVLSTLTTDDIAILLSQTTLFTPNAEEALILSGKNTLDEAARFFHNQGCTNILITGTDCTDGDTITHYLYTQQQKQSIQVAKHNGNFRGSGCRLSTLCAIGLANHKTVEQTVADAQKQLAAGIAAATPISNNDYLINNQAIATHG